LPSPESQAYAAFDAFFTDTPKPPPDYDPAEVLAQFEAEDKAEAAAAALVDIKSKATQATEVLLKTLITKNCPPLTTTLSVKNLIFKIEYNASVTVMEKKRK